LEWADWVISLEELTGIGSESTKASLLIPKPGESDLSPTKARDLSDAIYKKLFRSYLVTSQELKILARKPAEESLPLLYYSAWFVRNQEDTHAFWRPFCDAVVRNALAESTVQIQLAPLITALWRKMHQELGIYRPQEGYVHIKWPQSHAGLTPHEIVVVSNALTKSVGWSEEVPDILYIEPDAFLWYLRLWLQRNIHVPRRLQRLIFGPDGPALVVAELAQRSLLKEWPLNESIVERSTSESHIQPPYLSINPDSSALSVILPEGEIPGYANWTASYSGEVIRLVVSYSEKENMTYYKQYEWVIKDIPWSRQINLASENNTINLPEIPDNPFTKSNPGALMFDFNSRRCIRGWRPYRHYFLMLNIQNPPDWVFELFSDIELINPVIMGDLQLRVFSVIGRDIVSNLGKEKSIELLHRMEDVLQNFGAVVRLPDIDELLQPELLLCGGLITDHGPYPTYLIDYLPNILIKNIADNEMNISIHKHQDRGDESLISAIQIPINSNRQSIALQLPKLEGGLYSIKGFKQRKQFRVVSQPPMILKRMMELKLELLQSEKILSPDDIRHFETEGVVVRAWPNAKVYLTVTTESGIYTYPVHLDENGEKIVHAYEIQLPTSTKWVQLRASSWLAFSNTLDLAVRAYIPTNKWTLSKTEFTAEVRGVKENTPFRVFLIPFKPWIQDTVNIHGNLKSDYIIQLKIENTPQQGWIIVSNEATEDIWMISRIGRVELKYEFSDFLHLASHEYIIPDYLDKSVIFDSGLKEMVSLIRFAEIVRVALLPIIDSPIPEYLERLFLSQEISTKNFVQLPNNWRREKAQIIPPTSRSGTSILCVADQEFKVYVTTSGKEIRLLWAESSSPCICAHCRKIMTQDQWQTHTSGKHINTLTTLNREFSATRFIDWKSLIEVLEHLLLDAINTNPDTAPNGLEKLWTKLQQAYKVEGSIQGVDPATWIKGVFSSWYQLYKLIYTKPHVHAWLPIWENVATYKNGLKALSKLSEFDG